jgi:HAE1 family hydrophobic/amphiphilic exporter-1
MMTLTRLLLGVGMIVDASIVVSENIYNYRERGAKPNMAALLGSQEMIAAITSSTITTVVVFVPIYLYKNQLEMIGALFQEIYVHDRLALLARPHRRHLSRTRCSRAVTSYPNAYPKAAQE